MESVDQRVAAMLVRITGEKAVLDNPDLDLFASSLLDSLALVEFIVAVGDEFGLTISPAQIDREAWTTPRKISSYIESQQSA